MADEFDPYYSWLGIPPEEQPADLYRLLGVRQFEPNGDVISNAADQRIVYLRTFQIGKRSALSQQLLKELTQAKLCLLTPESRQTYDQQLRSQLASQAVSQSLPLQPIAAAPTASLEPQLDSLPAWNMEQYTLNTNRGTSPFEKLQQWGQSLTFTTPTMVIALGMVGLSLSILGIAVVWVTWRGNSPPTQNSPQVAQVIPAAVPAPAPAPPPATPIVPAPTAPSITPMPMAAATITPPPQPEKIPEEKTIITVTPSPAAKEPPAPAPEEPALELVDAATAAAELRKLGAQVFEGQPNVVNMVHFAGPNLSDATVKYVASFPQLQSLSLNSPKVTGQSLRYLSNLASLENLNLFGCTISDKDLSHLAQLTNLKNFQLRDTLITGEGFQHLKNLSNLEMLSLPDSVTPEIFPHLRSFQKLKSFNPSPKVRNDDDMRHICQIKGLKDFSFQLADSSSVTTEGYKQLENLTELENCYLPSSPPPGVSFYLRKAKLRMLLFPENATEKEIEPFVNMKTLRQLIAPRDISDEGLKMVAKMTNLEQLYVGQAARVTNAGLAELSPLHSLKELTVCSVNDQGVAHLTKIKSLRNINLFDSTTITLAGWKLLPELSLLETLSLPPNFSDEGIRILKACPHIKHLDFRGAAMTTEGLSHLKEFKNLEHLDLAENKFASKDIETLKSLTTLKLLFFRKCIIKPEDLDAIKAALPNCQVYNYP